MIILGISVPPCYCTHSNLGDDVHYHVAKRFWQPNFPCQTLHILHSRDKGKRRHIEREQMEQCEAYRDRRRELDSVLRRMRAAIRCMDCTLDAAEVRFGKHAYNSTKRAVHM